MPQGKPSQGHQAAWHTLSSKYPRPLDGVCRPMRGNPVTIVLKKGATPTNTYTFRPVPINLEAAFNKELDEQIAAGILEEANDTNDPGEWLNPMVVTRKKDPTKVRITVDLRELNKATHRPVYPSPSPWHLVCRIPASAHFFTVLDGLKGFHQIDLAKSSRKLTTFATPRGRMRYLRMPMGWHASSDVFNERMAAAFKGIPNMTRLVEDILIHSPTWEEHMVDVARVLHVANENDISFNRDKVQFAQTEVKFGGFVISQGHYCIDPSLTEDLRTFPVPVNRHQLRSFLGLAQQLGDSPRRSHASQSH